jgi:hypothetical protein
LISWIDKLERHGTEVAVEYKRRRPRPRVHDVCITGRTPSDNDPGEIAVGYYTVAHGELLMTDATGKPLRDAKPVKVTNENARSVAGMLTRQHWVESRSNGFDGPLNYPPISIA